MYRLANILRKGDPLLRLTRGAKKKKEAEAKIQSNDIVNIFKDRTDPQPQPIEQYPVYVQQFSLTDTSIVQQTIGCELNIPYLMPNQSNYKSFIRGAKRQKCKFLHQYHHMDRNPNINDEKKELMYRLGLFNVLKKTKQQLQEQRLKQQEQLAAMEQQDDDQF